MVWVLNNTSGDITVSVTGTSGGASGDYVITTATPPHMAQNHWQRTATETLKATLTNGKTYTESIGPNDQITIYDDAVVIIDSGLTVLMSAPKSQSGSSSVVDTTRHTIAVDDAHSHAPHAPHDPRPARPLFGQAGPSAPASEKGYLDPEDDPQATRGIPVFRPSIASLGTLIDTWSVPNAGA
ncbi:hypothetical protein M422DRAFT_259494 [Sphaerobolus stellatus SS14]|uniref:Uncharacterized protein n=1 Tax=Sphaerobolus stellatus (strain SS14) TaxID=990650 RepID=A0A0C9VKC2_SPHS4|nr:hypothetical protein M422DRAFT_259494 [Sphaerobolus stellatus SS14]